MRKIVLFIVCAIMTVGCAVFFVGCNKDNGLVYAYTEDSCSIISGIDFTGEELNIPNTHDGKPVTGVLEYAFVRNYSVTSVTLPESVTFISAGAFYCCSELTTVNLPATIESIGYNAFGQCNRITTINYNGTKAQWYSVEKAYLWDDYSGDYSIVCTDGTLTKAQNGNDLGTAGLLYEIYLKSGQCFLENGLNTGAEHIEIASEYYNYPVTAIGERAFSGANIKSVKIPEGIVYIEDMAFEDCELLTEVWLPSTICNIGMDSFDGCTALTALHFNGTRAAWNDITKDPSWDKDNLVRCTDDNA